MVTYVDTQAGGTNSNLIQGGTFEWPLSLETSFYLNVANNIIDGQPTGQTVTFICYDIHGSSQVSVPYGISVSYPMTGHIVRTIPATLPTVPNADLWIVIDDNPIGLSVNTVGVTT